MIFADAIFKWKSNLSGSQNIRFVKLFIRRCWKTLENVHNSYNEASSIWVLCCESCGTVRNIWMPDNFYWNKNSYAFHHGVSFCTFWNYYAACTEAVCLDMIAVIFYYTVFWLIQCNLILKIIFSKYGKGHYVIYVS